MTKLSNMVKHGRFQQVKVKSGNEWTFKSAHNLVPGDVILIHTNQIVPADCVLLSGEVLVNESSLTGEAAAMAKEGDYLIMQIELVSARNSEPYSLEIRIPEKTSMMVNDKPFIIDQEKLHVLYGSTKVILDRTPGESKGMRSSEL